MAPAIQVHQQRQLLSGERQQTLKYFHVYAAPGVGRALTILFRGNMRSIRYSQCSWLRHFLAAISTGVFSIYTAVLVLLETKSFWFCIKSAIRYLRLRTRDAFNSCHRMSRSRGRPTTEISVCDFCFNGIMRVQMTARGRRSLVEPHGNRPLRLWSTSVSVLLALVSDALQIVDTSTRVYALDRKFFFPHFLGYNCRSLVQGLSYSCFSVSRIRRVKFLIRFRIATGTIFLNFFYSDFRSLGCYCLGRSGDGWNFQ